MAKFYLLLSHPWLVSGIIIRCGGAPPSSTHRLFKSKLILQLNTVITWPEIRVYTMLSANLHLASKQTLHLGMNWGVRLIWKWENIKEGDYDKTKSRVTRSWNSKRDLGFLLLGFKIIAGVTWGLFLSRKRREAKGRREWLGILVWGQPSEKPRGACLPGLSALAPRF